MTTKISTRFTPELVGLVEEAAMASFWWVPPFQRFLTQCGVAQRHTAKLHERESKREMLNRLLPSLLKTEAGKSVIVRMANYLAEMESYPGLKGTDDYQLKLDNAKQATRELKNYLERQNKIIADKEKQAEARKNFEKLQESIRESKQSIEKLNNRFKTELFKVLGTQEGGYLFETFFYDLLSFYEIENRRPYKDSNGRQIDGSITIEGTTYLVELKFTSNQIGPKEISDFDGKLNSKADNTMGVFLSISGFTEGAIKTASRDRTPILLLDHTHLILMLEANKKPDDIINRIRRYASQTGNSFLEATHF